MRTVRRLLYTDVIQSVAYVALAFLALFFFVDMVEAMADIGKDPGATTRALAQVALLLPSHLYELMPIAVLIGTIYAMARLAQTSEFTILRTGGLSPGRALALLGALGLGFSALTLVIGDGAAPLAEREATRLASRQDGTRSAGRAGAWIKDSRRDAQGEHRSSVRVGRVGSGNELLDLTLFEFAPDGRLLARTEARRATLQPGRWDLAEVTRSVWHPADDSAAGRWTTDRLPAWTWPTRLDRKLVDAATSPPESMTIPALWAYLSHLRANDQETRKLEITFWQRALYPLACVVMMALALPFAYLQARRGGLSVKVFGGIMLGISFVLLNNISSHVGELQHWTPWMAAAGPSLLYLLLSLGALAWLVRFR